MVLRRIMASCLAFCLFSPGLSWAQSNRNKKPSMKTPEQADSQIQNTQEKESANQKGGWTDAKWGMKGDELETIFAGRIQKAKPEESRHVDKTLKAEYVIYDYEIQGHKFNVYFGMDAVGSLRSVVLSSKSDKLLVPTYNDLASLLEQKYGNPSRKDDPSEPLTKDRVFLREWILPDTTIILFYLHGFVTYEKGIYLLTVIYKGNDNQGEKSKL